MSTFDHSISEADWELIGDGILQGRYNLLLGAGASLDSLSGIKGEHCLSSGALTEKLFNIHPGLKSGSSINRIYRTLSSQDIEENITKRFSGCIAGSTVSTISRFRWRRIFTLNVDDALEDAYEKSDIPVQKIESINYLDPYSEIRDLRKLPLVHLHGFARRPKDGYIFDVSEYMRSIKTENIWAHVLGQLIRTEPFIVIGTSFEEPDISYFLADRSHAIPRGGRAPSLLIEPCPDSGTKVDCDEYALKLFEKSSEEFFQEVAVRFPNRPTVDEAIEENLGKEFFEKIENPAHRAEFHADFERVPEDHVSITDGGPLFALGHPATWSDIQGGRDIDRPEATDIQLRISKSGIGKTWIILGDAGAGKTTLLRRIAWNLAQSEKPCFWLRSVGRIRVDAAIDALSSLSKRAFVFIDNFADNVVEILRIRDALKDKDVIFVAAERSYRFDHLKKIYGNDFLIEWELRSIGKEGARSLEKSYKNMGLFDKGKKDSDYIPLDRELIAIACCRIINNFEPLANIIARSVKDASEIDRKCYILAALGSHCYRQGVEYDIISSLFPDYHVDIQIENHGALPLKVVDISGTEFVTPLNEAFSDGILRKLAKDSPNLVEEAFEKLARGFALE